MQDNLAAATMMPTTEAIMSTRCGSDDLGRMSAEAVLTQYEATAKEVESMGELVKTWSRSWARHWSSAMPT
jgi:hypothetical protein